jgi:outer membrane protein assembly factor BamC
MQAVPSLLCRSAAWCVAGFVIAVLAGCDTMAPTASIGKRIEYKTTGSAPALEIPPDLTTPRFDDRFSATTASGVAAQQAGRPRSELLPQSTDARIVRAGTERWLVVKSPPDLTWTTLRQFWTDLGFVIAVEQPVIGVMETDWAENRAEIPQDIVRQTVGKYIDIFYTTYKRDKFRTRVERGVEPGTLEIYISHRGMEQMPTTIQQGSAMAFAWAVLPPNPDLEAEMLSRLLQRFGTPPSTATAAVAATTPPTPGQPTSSDLARLEKGVDGASRLVVNDPFDRAWRRVGLALDRTGFTVVDRDRSNGLYFVRYADPDSETAKARDAGWLAQLMFWKTDEKDRPEQYRIKVAEATPGSVVTVQDPKGEIDRSTNSERILALLREQLR